MQAFDSVFLETARLESRAFIVPSSGPLPRGDYLLREFYCEEPRCDCRRVILHVVRVQDGRTVASINYAFEAPEPPFDDEPQVYLDPLNPQSDLSEVLLGMFQNIVANDAEYRERLIRHYEMFKQVVDDSSHPDHAKVRTELHDDPTFRPAFPSRSLPQKRADPRVGPNEPCPCGSGRKYKKCCWRR